MKKVWYVLLLVSALVGDETAFVGAGPYVQSQPYKKADPVVLASPVVIFDNSLFYVRWTRLGVYFAGSKSETSSWGLSFTAQPQILGYYETAPFNQLNPRAATPILHGMKERESSWEGGLSAVYSRGAWFAEALAMYDLFGIYDGLKVRLETGRSFKTGRWYFLPSVLAVWLSQPFANYYFGVESGEADATLGRNAYRAPAALNLAAQIYVKYAFSPHWQTLLNARVDVLSPSITHSPLVGASTMTTGMISLLYAFEY